METRDVSTCPNSELLAAWLDAGLGLPGRARVEAHLVVCDKCRALVALVLETHGAIHLLPRGGNRDPQLAGFAAVEIQPPAAPVAR
jgi:hypothetical protein